MRSSALLFIPMILLLAHDVEAQSRVEGVVRATDGAALAGVQVRLSGPEIKTPVTVITDAEGRYGFDKVKAGTRVEVEVLQRGRRVARTFTLVTKWVETVDMEAERESTRPATAEDLDPMEGPSGVIRGIVRSGDGSAIAAARVAIGDTGVETVTDAAGRYVFSHLRSGLPIELQVTADGFAAERKPVTIPEGDRSQIDFVLTPARTKEDVKPASGLAVLKPSGDGTTVTVAPDAVSALPAFSRNDIFRALQFLPGVAATGEAASELFVRGGTPGETLVTYDGFTVYPSSRPYGRFSALNMAAIERVGFSESVFDAADGGRLAGALRVKGLSGDRTRPTGLVDLSLLGWGTRLSLPLANRGSVVVAARQSPPAGLYEDMLDRFSGGTRGTQSARGRIARFSGGTLAAPLTSSFHDVNGRLDLVLPKSDRLAISFYDGRDDANQSRDLTRAVRSTIAVPDVVELPSDAAVQVSDAETWTGHGVGATWERRWSSSASTTVSVGRSEFSKGTAEAFLLTSPSTGVDYSFVEDRGGSSGLTAANEIRDTTLRIDNSIRIGFEHALTAGGEVVALDGSYRLLREVARQTNSDGAFASALAPLVDRKDAAKLVTVFVQDSWRPMSRLTLAPGARVTHADLAGSTYVDPRVTATYSLGSKVQFKAGWSIDHQAVNRIVREDREHGDGEVWTLSNGTEIPVARAQQTAAGLGVATAGLRFDAQFYYRALDDLTIFAPRLLPGVAAADDPALFHSGSGSARGLELAVQQKARANSFWTSYRLGRVELDYPTLEAGTFPASYDQLHELKVADTVRAFRGWSLGGSWVVASGRPQTPATGVEPVWFPSGDSIYHVTFGSKNSTRLPAYHRLDLSSQVAFRAHAVSTTVGATVFNVYNKRNILFRDYETLGSTLMVTDVPLMRRALNVWMSVGF